GWERAISVLLKTLALMTPLIEGLPPNLKAQLLKGAVTSDERRKVEQVMNVHMRPEGHRHPNAKNRREANRKDGRPLISFNIDTLVGYADRGVEGLAYLLLHEIGHMTEAGWTLNAKLDAERREKGEKALTLAQNQENELLANDVAKTVADYFDPGVI